MTRKPSISRRNRIHWHYVRDDALFFNIKEYYACVMGEAAPKPKASAKKKKGTGEGTSAKPGVPDVPSDDSEEELSWKSSEDEEV
nr:hypothetical protein [Tanacetum cinerariifolium]